MKVNEIIKKRRKELGLTLKDVARELGVSESLISRYESNDVKNMGIDKITPLAKVLKCSPAYLMGWTEEKLEQKKDSLHLNHPALELNGKFSFKEHIKNKKIRILDILNSNSAVEKVYNLDTDKYEENKIDNISLSFTLNDKKYTSDDISSFLELFEKYNKLSKEQQKYVENYISQGILYYESHIKPNRALTEKSSIIDYFKNVLSDSSKNYENAINSTKIAEFTDWFNRFNKNNFTHSENYGVFIMDKETSLPDPTELLRRLDRMIMYVNLKDVTYPKKDNYTNEDSFSELNKNKDNTVESNVAL